MRALFVQQDHVSPVGPVGERFAERGYDVEEFLVVPQERFQAPGVEVSVPGPARLRRDRAHGRAVVGLRRGDDRRVGARGDRRFFAEPMTAAYPSWGSASAARRWPLRSAGRSSGRPSRRSAGTTVDTDDPDLVESGPVVPVAPRPLDHAASGADAGPDRAGAPGVRDRPQHGGAVPSRARRNDAGGVVGQWGGRVPARSPHRPGGGHLTHRARGAATRSPARTVSSTASSTWWRPPRDLRPDARAKRRPCPRCKADRFRRSRTRTATPPPARASTVTAR